MVSVKVYALGAKSVLEGEIAKKESRKNKDFFIISRKESILSMCLVKMAATAIATVDITALVIDCWIEKSITWDLVVISLKQATDSRNLSISVSQKALKKPEEADLATLVLFLEISRREKFFSLMATTQSMSFWRDKLMWEAFLWPILRWNLWIA